jgi:malonyl-CoA O-methyltransferase
MMTDDDRRFVPDARAVRRAFERAATRYDSAAVVAREVGRRMLERLQYIKQSPQRILDAGCGTGRDTAKLAAHYPQASIINLDSSPAMLAAGRATIPWWKRQLPFLSESAAHQLCADLQALPLANESIGFIWSNLALHWCDLDRTIAEMHRVLRADGLFMFTTLGPDTLKEMRMAFAGLDDYMHVQRFIDMHDIGDGLIRAGFADPVMDMEILTVTFADFNGLANELKATGSTNHLPGRRPGLLGKRLWHSLAERYEAYRKEGKLPLTVEVIYGHAWKPVPKSVNGRQVIEFRPYNRASDV